jgi:hypothetical protein
MTIIDYVLLTLLVIWLLLKIATALLRLLALWVRINY